MSRRLLILLPSLFLMAACSAPGPIADDRPDEPVEPAHPAYETFDPAPYAVEPPAVQEASPVEHDVPDQLMAGTITPAEDDEMEGSVIQGFRIQLFTTEAKASADAVRDDVIAWWRRSQQQDDVREAFEYGLHPVVVFGSPFYRVRVGLFLDRQDAAPALEILRQRFPEAFIVPDTITISRE
jgi:hypothetical protein